MIKALVFVTKSLDFLFEMGDVLPFYRKMAKGLPFQMANAFDMIEKTSSVTTGEYSAAQENICLHEYFPVSTLSSFAAPEGLDSNRAAGTKIHFVK